MKKMKLFFLGICAAMASTAMGQVTLTANDATDKAAGWTLSLQTPKEIAGWQMKIALPEGVTISSKELKVGDATFTEYDGVKLPARYGAKYKAVGTPTADGVFLFFIPVAAEYTADDFKIDGQEGEACTITLKADSYEGAAAVQITNIVAADKDGNSTDLAGADKSFAVNHPKGDVTANFVLDVRDMSVLLEAIQNEAIDTLDKSIADMNADGSIDVRDLASQLEAIQAE